MAYGYSLDQFLDKDREQAAVLMQALKTANEGISLDTSPVDTVQYLDVVERCRTTLNRMILHCEIEAESEATPHTVQTKPIEWGPVLTDVPDVDGHCVLGKTPYGVIRISWQPWKDENDPSIPEHAHFRDARVIDQVPWGDGLEGFSVAEATSLEKAKEDAEKLYARYLTKHLVGNIVVEATSIETDTNKE